MTIKEQEQILEKLPFYTKHSSKREIRHEFFDNIETEVQAYILGIYASDGSVNAERKTMTLGISQVDTQLIELFKKYISPNAYTRITEPRVLSNAGRNGIDINDNGSIYLDITSVIIYKSLCDKGFGSRKTYNDSVLPNISAEMLPHFIRGYFDGDGCITTWLAKEKGKADRVRSKFDISSKTRSLLDDINSEFSKVGITCNINYLKRDDMYRLCTSSRVELGKLFKYLYSDSNFRLDRKYDKFNRYVNTEITQLIAEYRNA